jgi:hypothetical protein
LDAHWRASAAANANAEHDIYDDDAICDYPQSGERILSRNMGTGTCEKMQILDFNGIGVQEFIV